MLEHTPAYSSILGRARAYQRVLGVQSPSAAAMKCDTIIIVTSMDGAGDVPPFARGTIAQSVSMKKYRH